MREREKAWKERRRGLRARLPTIRIAACRISPAAAGKGYDVVIRGAGFKPSIAPPRVTVGGAIVTALRFSDAGDEITGRLDAAPEGRAVEIDLGFARAQGRCEDAG